jgi:enterobactin synthetase component D
MLARLDQAISIAQSLRALAPTGVRTACRAIDPIDWFALHEAERRLVARAVAKRRHEFATGRAVLHDVLGTDEPILADARRAPVWPFGYCGSLAHDDRYAVAAVSSDPAVRAVGIDIEPATTLTAELARVILRADEGETDAHLAFAAKEAVYKAWSSLGGGMLEHHDVRLWLRDGHVAATVDGSTQTFHGRYATASGHTVVLVVVGREDPAWN